ncbi:MAG: chorismate-binding protein [Flavobacteriaceae bacterium]|nr:chorismate-binding protein [Flavobacteriaceae bacterium]MCY4216387.1 chorismate-binding protein [Flavobacteriaceae bacterium]MCY4253831.1 chorismate-binding protein [Flavobacteriaceae bacterium]
MIKQLIEKFDDLLKENRAFVFFRFPNSDRVHLYIQNGLAVNRTSEFSSPGFVLAPFSYQGEHSNLLIRDQSEEFLIQTYKPRREYKNPIKSASFDQSSFINLVINAKKYILEKNATKVVVSASGEINNSSKFSRLFCDTLLEYQSAFVSFFHHPEIATWLSATPELLLQKKGLHYKTVALAGTKSSNPHEYRPWTEKEKHEQKIVQNQIHDDLKSICGKYKIDISQTSDLNAGHLFHLLTEFEFQTDSHPTTILKLLHPSSAIAGHPKENALAFLKHNEGYSRSFYSGFLGPTDINDFSLFVNIRCAQMLSDTVRLYVGAGITLDSDPESEWEEILQKSKTISKMLN